MIDKYTLPTRKRLREQQKKIPQPFPRLGVRHTVSSVTSKIHRP